MVGVRVFVDVRVGASVTSTVGVTVGVSVPGETEVGVGVSDVGVGVSVVEPIDVAVGAAVKTGADVGAWVGTLVGVAVCTRGATGIVLLPQDTTKPSVRTRKAGVMSLKRLFICYRSPNTIPGVPIQEIGRFDVAVSTACTLQPR